MTPTIPQQQRSFETADSIVEPSLQAETQRFRLIELRARRTPAGHCRAEVELQWSDGSHIVGCATGQSSAFGDMRIAAEAALDALHQGGDDPGRFELVGVKGMRAFDATVVIVSVVASWPHGPSSVRLVGAAFAEDDDVSRGAVLAVLNATNRIIGRRPLAS
jgi:hypothetical protein